MRKIVLKSLPESLNIDTFNTWLPRTNLLLEKHNTSVCAFLPSKVPLWYFKGAKSIVNRRDWFFCNPGK